MFGIAQGRTFLPACGEACLHRGELSVAPHWKVLFPLSRGGFGIFPNCPRGRAFSCPGLWQAKLGIAYIAEQTGMPVIPVGIVGTTDDFWQKASKGKRPRVEMRIGKPIQLPLVEGKGTERREFASATLIW